MSIFPTQRDTVYVIGAGFSAGLGYPLTHDLLVRLWKRLDIDFQKKLKNIIRFHHSNFNLNRFTTFPNIEQILTEIVVNQELFDASRQNQGRFTKKELEDVRSILLAEIAAWFHDIFEDIDLEDQHKWLSKFKEKLLRENAAIISFNWDLVLDRQLFGDELNATSYGFKDNAEKPVLLKPHGSLNWFEEKQAKTLQKNRRVKIFNGVHAFLRYRAPLSKKERVYTPLIVPPVHLKRFDEPVFQALWKNCTSVLSTAKEVVFLGYSMPAADLHAQFIMRCGFYNQVEGPLMSDGKRGAASGAAKVTIVNLDQDAARRTEAVCGDAKCTWRPMPIAQWINETK